MTTLFEAELNGYNCTFKSDLHHRSYTLPLNMGMLLISGVFLCPYYTITTASFVSSTVYTVAKIGFNTMSSLIGKVISSCVVNPAEKPAEYMHPAPWNIQESKGCFAYPCASPFESQHRSPPGSEIVFDLGQITGLLPIEENKEKEETQRPESPAPDVQKLTRSQSDSILPDDVYTAAPKGVDLATIDLSTEEGVARLVEDDALSDASLPSSISSDSAGSQGSWFAIR